MFDLFAKNTLGPLILRVGLGVIFIYHGLGKVNPDTDWGATWQQQAGLPNPHPGPMQMAYAWGEMIGGVALALGLLTRLAALGVIALMVGAIYEVHWHHFEGEPIFDVSKGGFEYNFAIIVMCLSLLVTGPGTMAIDRVFFRRRPAS